MNVADDPMLNGPENVIEPEVKLMTVSRTIQILFLHRESKSYTICKVDVKKLNWKLRKLQNEGMFIVAVMFDNPNWHRHRIYPKPKQVNLDDSLTPIGMEGEFALMQLGGIPNV